MVFLHITPKTPNNVDDLDKHIQSDNNKKIFLLIFMEGCGPCEATKPEWKKIEEYLDDDLKNDEDTVITDLDQIYLKDIKELPTQPKGFPTMLYITDKGKKYEEFNEGRGVESFIKWIKSKVNKPTNSHNKHHGGKRTSKKSKKSKKTKKSKKSKKSRRNRNR